MTGITRISKESVFSDLNNLTVITTTSDAYADCFGFTEEEVFQSLDQFGMPEKKDLVKQWYDGFCFGTHRDVYNPWSITNYLKEKKLRPYWAATSSNGLISKLLQSASVNMKEELEKLIGQVQKQMKAAAAELNFEMAAELRDKMITLKKSLDDMEE